MAEKFSIREYLAIGDIVQITLSSKGARKITAKTEIYNLMESKRLLLSQPLIDGVIFEPTLEKTYDMLCYKNDLGEYSFRATFVKEEIVNGKKFFIVEAKSSFTLRQRREYYRHSIYIDVDVKVFEKSGDNFIERGIVRLLNISGGGLGLESYFELVTDNIYYFEFELENQKFFIPAQVVRHRKIEGSKKRLELGVMFVNIDNSERRRIVGVVNFAQIKQLKKDLR